LSRLGNGSFATKDLPRVDVLFEIYQTEKQYVTQLDELVVEWKLPMEDQGILNEADLLGIFGRLESLLEVNTVNIVSFWRVSLCFVCIFFSVFFFVYFCCTSIVGVECDDRASGVRLGSSPIKDCRRVARRVASISRLQAVRWWLCSCDALHSKTTRQQQRSKVIFDQCCVVGV
jgi:hypothetical protein